MKFKLTTHFTPSGDQPTAIDKLTNGVLEGQKSQVLLGVTGSGKTFTMANIIAKVQKPTLILAHNKTLAAQLYQEFKAFFPDNAVAYFVSYYDYYQPEAYIARTDTYIEKDMAINDEIDKMRLSATRSLLERNDVIVVASVSCIYGLGSPDYYSQMNLTLTTGQECRRDNILLHLIQMQYERNDYDLSRSTFRVRGDVLDIFPAYEDNLALRIEFFGDEIEKISEIDPLTGKFRQNHEEITIYPGSHHVTPEDVRFKALETIKAELKERIRYYEDNNLLIEAQRIAQRTQYDLEMINETGFCKGIENYSRHFSNRKEGEPPSCLLDYFPKDYLIFIDESHQTIPQLHAMYNGDKARKSTLVDFGFRLPSAFDNRPLKFEETYSRFNQVIYVSATPAPFEVTEAGGVVVEQIIRPTGLLDPVIEIRPAFNQVDDCLDEIRTEVSKGHRVLVTTLTKRLAEELTKYLLELDIKAKYLHSDIDTIERTNIILGLRKGEFDVLVGINLLREGLDIPEVSLVTILDADKEGFLRSTSALIQTSGRAARNENGRVIMYADKITKSIAACMEATDHRRQIQMDYNQKHGITPTSVKRSLSLLVEEQSPTTINYLEDALNDTLLVAEEEMSYSTLAEVQANIQEYEKLMKESAKALDFEAAVKWRDLMLEEKKKEIRLS